MKAEAFDKATVHWMPMGASCHVAVHRGAACEDGVAIRPNVPEGAASPVGWQAPLRMLPHAREMTEAEAASAFAALGPVTLLPGVHDQMGQVELRGATEGLKFSISTPSHKGIDPLSETEEGDYRAYLAALAQRLFGDTLAPGDAGSAAWR